MTTNNRTFQVSGTDGKMMEATQLATFTRYIKGVQFRFVVTRLAGSNVASVTHRVSRIKVCDVATHSAIAAAGDWILAGRSALEDFLKLYGETRVHQVLSAAEKGKA